MLNEFEAPIPGQSLAGKELGAYPWESPPDFPDPNDAYLFFINRILDDQEILGDMARLLELGTPAEVLADGILFNAFQIGQITPDVTILLREPLQDLIKLVGEQAGVDIQPLDPMIEEVQVQLAEEIFAEQEAEQQGEPEMPQAMMDEEPLVKPEPQGIMAMPQMSVEEQADG
tara:strand:+ start:980 stop:1498 length:519 start_codon:yes stop_codon:yes gene_type:complete